MDKYGTPTPKMEASLLYKLHGHNSKQGVKVDSNRFREVFASKYGKVRIFKVLGVSAESKEWVADPSNRDCDCPTCWYCTGNYPPALEQVLSSKKDFAQLEDFNKKTTDDAYQKAYHENMADPAKARAAAKRDARKKLLADKAKKEDEEFDSENSDEHEEEDENKPEERELTKEMLEEMRVEVGKEWADNSHTSRMWEHIKDNEIDALLHWLNGEPQVAFIRSADGRGPMFWAHEYKRAEIIKVLTAYGVRDTDKDVNGMSAKML